MNAIKWGDQVWPAIAEVLALPGPRRVAVPFIGVDAPELLVDLGPKDLLVCNAGSSALKQGITYPSALREILARGVKIRSVPKLHAKVYTSSSRAFVGSANASSGSIEKIEAGVVISTEKQVAHLAAQIEALAKSRDATRVDEAFLDLADHEFRTPKGGGGTTRLPRSWRLHMYPYGDPVPTSILRAAESQRIEIESTQGDLSASIDFSWGQVGAWKKGDVCLWVERSAEDPDSWLADPPSVCIAARPVGGRSRQVVYWWRTPGVPSLSWGPLHRKVLLHTGRRLDLETSTSVQKVTTAVLEAFGVNELSILP